ncbi:YwhD family protein [Microaerobacter geothermalis]|uniref:YwhD family protein n=1 Tax=Microaerobacter geothermalis TaxID=674972 RepID=UPI001F2FE591|nr:YwhD family protein [Microaerobacter geothermalis]MCF6094103.1 YwhD family protein [Microaerobacter geothermalis]
MDLLHPNNSKKDKKNRSGLGIISATNTHGSFGAGVLDLNSLAPVIIDGDEAYVDMGALHARSQVEKGIKFLTNKEDVPNGKPYWIVWVAMDRNEKGPYYAGVAASFMLVDREAKRGYKILAEHVNRMDDALKRRIRLAEMDDRSKRALKKLLVEQNPEFWENSRDELKENLQV